MSKCDTMKVVSDDIESGFMIVNKDDYDETVHEMFDAGETDSGGAPEATADHKGAGKWRVTLASGEVLEEVFNKAGASAKVEELNSGD